MPPDSQRNRLLIMTAAIAAMSVAGWLMIAERDYGAETAAPKPATTAPKVPAEKVPQGSQPPAAPAQPAVPTERGPAPTSSTPRPPVPLEYEPKPLKPEPKTVEPEPPQTVIQKRVFRGASDDTQSADTLLQFDSDRNGRVDRREAAASDFMVRHFDEIDADGDGRITPEEMRAFDARRALR